MLGLFGIAMCYSGWRSRNWIILIVGVALILAATYEKNIMVDETGVTEEYNYRFRKSRSQVNFQNLSRIVFNADAKEETIVAFVEKERPILALFSVEDAKAIAALAVTVNAGIEIINKEIKKKKQPGRG